MGIRSKERVGRVLEGIEILRRLWSETSVTHSGKCYQFADVEALPKPVQNPVPIWIGADPDGVADPGLLDRVLRRVAAHSDGWQTGPIAPEEFRSRFDRIRDHAAGLGRDPSKMDSCIHLMVNINEDRDEAYREAQAYLTSYYGASFVSRELIELWVAYGPPEAVAGKIQSYVDAGCTTPVLRFVSSDLNGQLTRCIEEVMPSLVG